MNILYTCLSFCGVNCKIKKSPSGINLKGFLVLFKGTIKKDAIIG
jgi:hypothetical protein